MHPSLRILALILLAVSVQYFHLVTLLFIGSILVTIAFLFYAPLLQGMVRRSRWLLLVMFLIYAFATPGEYPEWWGLEFSPTYEGVDLGALQAGRLIVMLTGLSILLGSTRRDDLMAGIYPLLFPLRWIGLSPERFTARLWLTIHYVEQAPASTRGVSLSGLRAFDLSVFPAGTESVSFSLPAFSRIDWAILLVMCLLLATWLI